MESALRKDLMRLAIRGDDIKKKAKKLLGECERVGLRKCSRLLGRVSEALTDLRNRF